MAGTATVASYTNYCGRNKNPFNGILHCDSDVLWSSILLLFGGTIWRTYLLSFVLLGQAVK